MKYLDFPQLSPFNTRFKNLDAGDSILMGSIECYSLKATSHDRKFMNIIEKKLEKENPNLDDNIKSLFPSLVLLLNTSFPDFDFSNSRPPDFIKHASYDRLFQTITAQIHEIVPSANLDNDLFIPLNSMMHFNQCEFFSFRKLGYHPVAGSLWNFNVIIYSKSDKRLGILTFSCFPRKKRIMLDIGSDSESSSSDEEEEEETFVSTPQTTAARSFDDIDEHEFYFHGNKLDYDIQPHRTI